MKVGARVRVKDSICVYHYPGHRNQTFDIKDQEGEVVAIIQDWEGRPVSANLPVKVKFEKKFTAHFIESELELS
ncbi:MAG: ferredoxin--nitrite reductase [Symploca sp. SIO2C1]|nr:ferredoxin--nitrite reductase [Symploca sp. SIO2C1]